MQTIDRVQIENVIAQLSAIMQGALLMPERRKDDRRNNGNKTQGGAPGITHQVREAAHQVAHQVATQERAQVAPAQAPAPAPAPAKPLIQPKQPKDAPRKPAQDARPVAAEWPFQTYAAPQRPFPGYLWPYELKKMSQARRNEYFRKLNTGEIGPDQGDNQASNQAERRKAGISDRREPGPARQFKGHLWTGELNKLSKKEQAAYDKKIRTGEIGLETNRREDSQSDRRKAGAPGKRRKVAQPGETQAERERAETLARFAELDEILATGGGEFKIDFGTHSAMYQAIMVNCLNKGMPAKAAHNFASKKAYGDKAILY